MILNRRLLGRFALVTILAPGLASTRALAQGGPPLITDDPDTPGPGYWEVNIATVMNKTRIQRRVEAPLVDMNYGVGRRIQLKFEMPWVAARDVEQQAETGLGNAKVGVKWRFVGQEGARIAWSIYPQLEFNTARASVTKRIESDGYQFLMPTEITVQISHVEINAEIGRNFVEHGPGEWIFGLSTELEVSRRFELVAELHAERAIDETSDVIAVGGARLGLTPQVVLLMSAGHTVRSLPDEGPRTYVYVGLQFNLPRQFLFQQEGHRAVRH